MSHRLQPTALCIYEKTCTGRDGRPRRMIVGRLQLWPDGRGAQQQQWCVRPDCTNRGVCSMNFEAAADMKRSKQAKAKARAKRATTDSR